MRMGSPIVVVLCAGLAALALTNRALAQWIPTGVPICGDCYPDQHVTIPDGEGGAYVMWHDLRDYPETREDIYLQRVTGQGTIAPGWPEDGLPLCVCPNVQFRETLIADGEGGVYVLWQDLRNSKETSSDVYVQRVRGDGTLAPGWPEHGVPLSRDPYYQSGCAVASDGAGGLFATWIDARTIPSTGGEAVYAQHLTAAGEVAPGWDPDGLPVCTIARSPPPPQNRRLIADGTGGVLILWEDNRRYPPSSDIYAQRRLADGSIAPGWPVNGRPLLLDHYLPRVLPDGAGGFYLGSHLVPVEPAFDIRFALHRFTIEGEVAPGWPAEGVAVCAAPGYRLWTDFALDEAGGVLVGWRDNRVSVYGNIGETYVQRVRPDGTLPPGWTADGVLVSDLTDGQQQTHDVSVAPDGAGGVYVAWDHSFQGSRLVRAQHLDAAGQVAPGWPATGRRLAPSSRQQRPSMVTDGSGGAIVVWEEISFPQRVGLFAQRLLVDGPVAVELALAGVEASAERVVLRWHGVGAGALAAGVERSEDALTWQGIGVAAVEGPDGLRYEDRLVAPGTRHAYRLVYEEDGLTRRTRETWVEVPSALRLALEGFAPNPARGVASVAFTLASQARGSLEVLDLAGRRVLQRDVTALGPGRHALRLDEARLAPGVYLVRLEHGGQVRMARAVMVE